MKKRDTLRMIDNTLKRFDSIQRTKFYHVPDTLNNYRVTRIKLNEVNLKKKQGCLLKDSFDGLVKKNTQPNVLPKKLQRFHRSCRISSTSSSPIDFVAYFIGSPPGNWR